VTIVVGYVPSAEGQAALRRAIAEARLPRTGLLVLNTVSNVVDDPGYVPVQELELVRSQLAASASCTSCGRSRGATSRSRRSSTPPGRSTRS
jgi:hypothetical protein